DLANILGIDKAKVIKISAKLGTNVDKILELVIKNIPAPKINKEKPLRALIFDSAYNSYKGIIAYVRVMEGQVKNNEKIYLIAGKSNGQIKELGYFTPKLTESASLESGEIGYLATGIKEPGKIKVGDTITIPTVDNEIKLLPGYTEPQPVVFASFYPQDPDQYDALKEALAKLKLNDYALTFESEMKVMLGRGFRCGFLGSLHAEIISERLSREFGLELIISQPSVVYKIIDIKKKEHLIYSSSDWMDFSQILEIKEPWAKLEVISPSSFLGNCLKVLESVEGHQIERKYISEERLILVYEIPLRELIVGFYDNLKGATQGYASMNYEILDYRKGDLVKLEILIAGQKEEAFSKIVPKDKAYEEGSKIVKKLKTAMPSQLFSVALQAVVQGKIIARETIRAKGKDVTASLYGGDYSRKRKLLERQKKGKKELKVKGKIKIPPKTFLEMFKG
ncbi:MAG TPA: elongation factor 4, partial [Candidatus Parcubacteria bacterium]|nr:elongation factor 4 [Candidatus Parcubacteria bacterium]